MTTRARGASSAGETTAKVKAACEECRTRKTKCDGARPECGRCHQKGRTCQYETEPDEFRVTALKRRYTELAQSSENNEVLVRLLREKGHMEALEILNRIRANESITSILTDLDSAEPQTFGPEAERNLIAAIETSKMSSSSQEPLGSVSASVSAAASEEFGGPPGEPGHYTAVNKQSIAFLVETTTEPRSEKVDGSTSSTEDASVADSPCADFANRPRKRSSLVKRKRLSEPSRSASLSQVTAPNNPSALQYKGTMDALANKPRMHDKSWMKDLEHIKATDWDVYYTDTQSFLEVLKCYFVWENPILGFVHEKSFWDGMKAGGSEFCNSTLVHSILAYASKIYGLFNLDRADRAASMEHFALIESIKLWDWDADATVPANISTGLLIHITLTANGQDVEGQSYLAGAMNLAMRSGLYAPERVQSVYPESDPQLARQRATFAWDIYTHHGFHTLTFNKPPLLFTEPPVDIPSVEADADSNAWEPFPLIGASRPSLVSSKTQASAKLWRFGHRVLPLHRKYEHNVPCERHWRDAISLYEELRQWLETLSRRLSSLHGAPPCVFALHTDYYRCVLDLIRPFVNTDTKLPSQEISRQAHKITRESNLQLRMLVHQMELQYPDMPIPLNVLLTPLVSVANETLPMIPGQGPMSDDCYYFVLCLKMMRRMAGAYPVMRLMIIGLNQIAKRQGVELPEQARNIIDALEDDMRGSLSVNSSYPVHHDLLATNPEAASLQTLIRETNRLVITHDSPDDERRPYLLGGRGAG